MSNNKEVISAIISENNANTTLQRLFNRVHSVTDATSGTTVFKPFNLKRADFINAEIAKAYFNSANYALFDISKLAKCIDNYNRAEDKTALSEEKTTLVNRAKIAIDMMYSILFNAMNISDNESIKAPKCNTADVLHLAIALNDVKSDINGNTIVKSVDSTAKLRSIIEQDIFEIMNDMPRNAMRGYKISGKLENTIAKAEERKAKAEAKAEAKAQKEADKRANSNAVNFAEVVKSIAEEAVAIGIADKKTAEEAVAIVKKEEAKATKKGKKSVA